MPNTDGSDKRQPGRGAAIYTLLRIEAVVVIVLSFANLLVKISLYEIFAESGMSFPPLTILMHSSGGIWAAICLGIVLLLAANFLAQTGKTKTAVLLFTTGALAVFLEALAISLPYLKMSQTIG